MQSHEEGQYVEWRDYQWLLTEKQRLDNNCDYLDQKLDEEIEKSAMLCGQVERLTERLGGVRLIVTEEMYDELNTKYLEQQHELQNIALTARQILDEKIDLKEQVERLTKAGDAMVDMVDWEVPYERRKKLEADWNAAKEGKPRA
jgi:phage shock protein A